MATEPTATISADIVKQLRDRTGLGMMDCKKALSETKGDLEAAEVHLRKKGILKAGSKASREAKEGVIGSYIHFDKIGVLVEVNCETDFVAKTPAFRDLVRDITLQIAAGSPLYVSPDAVPESVLAVERDVASVSAKGKPEAIAEKIISGKVEAYYTQTCLLNQIFVKDETGKQTIKDMIASKIAELGENIVVRRFTRYQLGDSK